MKAVGDFSRLGQCFETVGWVTGRAYGSKHSAPIIHAGSLSKQIKRIGRGYKPSVTQKMGIKTMCMCV